MPDTRTWVYMISLFLLRFIGKLDLKIKELEPVLANITEVYSSGAVEGYSEQMLNLNCVQPKSTQLKQQSFFH